MGLSEQEGSIDFSANINPLGPPSSLEKEWQSYYKKMFQYPDPNGRELKGLISQKEQISEECILLGNGGAEIISLIGRLLSKKRILIIQPTFSEYEKACKVNGCTIVYHTLKEGSWELLADELDPKLRGVDAVFLCNPHNPTGICFTSQEITRLIDACSEHNCFLILDEAFYDFVGEYESYVPQLSKKTKLIILRSMTKMYSIPGVRLGYVMANEEVIQRLAEYQPHWSVNGLALLAGETCIQQECYIEETQKYITGERNRLFSQFQQLGYDFSPSHVNFYLLKDRRLADQYSFFHFLIKEGIIPRHTYNFPGLDGRWLRFAIRSHDENTQLMEGLEKWRQISS
jgi:threonine-phosphate decarboxylase